MELTGLQEHIHTLITLEETEAPVVSIYMNLQKEAAELREFMKRRVGLLKESLSQEQRPHFQRAMERIGRYVAEEFDKTAQGVAIFARNGTSPFFLALQFKVCLPNMIVVGSHPNIYHLVELKDTYHRYVVVTMNDKGACILEVNLGEVTKQLWTAQPKLREHIGQTWTREQYHHLRGFQGETFIQEEIKVLDRVMSAGGHTHLLLAGESAWRLRNALPHHLSAKFVDVVDISRQADVQDIVTRTIAAFVEKEEQESQEMADRLVREIKTDGLAVVGTEATLEALQFGIADVLVMAQSFDPEFQVKGKMVTLAEQHRCTIEIVNQSEALDRLGGVGCLLRYRTTFSENSSFHQYDGDGVTLSTFSGE
jgi:ribosomal protein L7Ae-like RNA K-turn-binding protein